MATQEFDDFEDVNLCAGTRAEEKLVCVWGKLVSLNQKNVDSIELVHDAMSIGRKEENDTVLTDPRVSGFHCCVRRETQDGGVTYTLEDLSSNGTFLNGTKVGRGKKVCIRAGDEIMILPEDRVGKEGLIAFAFKLTGEDESSCEPPTKKAKISKSNQDFVQALSDDLMCGICREILHDCVSLVPCLHNFCGACLSDWAKSNMQCPSCRVTVREVRKNHTLSNVIDSLLNAHPDQRRHPDDLADMNQRNRIKSDTVLMRDLNSDEYDSDGSDYSDASADVPIVDQCRECLAPRTDGFSCDPINKDHLICSACVERFPRRTVAGVTQQCVGCSQPFCGRYWDCRHANYRSFKPLGEYTFNFIPLHTFRNNQYELGILQNVLTAKSMSIQNMFANMLPKLDASSWAFRLNSTVFGIGALTTGGVTVPVKSTTPLCNGCATNAFAELCYKFRESLPADDLPADVTARSNCWYGRECRTQSRPGEHAKRLNHVCEPTPR
eukprot:GILK01004235.1.p1 GENE.GILK01004235.1~~GILK01004235.1.p1  ORF type:complete len:509 (+),score=97.03 GILK01004235.1:43-1527(+)